MMDIDDDKLIEFYKNDLVLKISAGAIIPEGLIATPDGLLVGIRLALNEKEFPLNLDLINKLLRTMQTELLKQGVAIESKEARKLIDYAAKWINSESLLVKYIKPIRNGFIDNSLIYVLGRRVFINDEQAKGCKALPFELPGTLDSAFEPKGCKEAYYNIILNKLAPYFVVVTVLIALSGCLVEFVNIDGGGFHFFGPSGVGKTILLKIAASVIGSSAAPDQGSQDGCYMLSWGATRNGIEAKFNLYNNGLLILDELGKYVSNNFGEDVYSLAGGAFKERMNSELESSAVSKPVSFMLLSSGELSAQELIMRRGGSSLGQGKSVRMPGIPINSSDLNYPALFPDSEMASKAFDDAINENSGILFTSFITALLNHKSTYSELREDVRERFESTLAEMKVMFPNNGSIESRVLKRFALFVVAGQLANEFGVLLWSKERIMDAISFVYERYYSYEPNRLSDAEIALKLIKQKLQSEQGNFIRVKSTSVPNKHYGYISDTHYYIYPETFKRWLSSANESEVIQLLVDKNFLKNEPGRNTLRTTEHLPKQANVRGANSHNHRRETFFCIAREIISLEFD
ncbi:DUF927 domain-containing protein [Pseudoalteromonas sp. PAR1]|uniref:DUF927 domain-containing protein n=1 Tax=Pseudoalteromonas sp. PAR1 TaxID=2853443 RepID=UPI00248CC4C1|nr:DUF927 domain-containing protein [Pseudoalteromonas sp. PAR1]